MDMTSGQQSIFGSQTTSLGKVAGKNIDYNDFSRTENALYGGSSGDVFVRRNSLWDFFVEDALIKEEADYLGLDMTMQEFQELQFGANPSPIVAGAFRDPATGQLNRQQLQQIQQGVESNTLNPQYHNYWSAMQKQIEKTCLQDKLNTLVSKSLYVPTWMVEGFHKENNDKVDFNYVRIPFDNINDADVSLTDADYSSYLTENTGQYYQDEETRKASYVVFDAKPTAKDSLDLRTALSGKITKWETNDNDSLFLVTNLGQYDEAYVKKGDLSEAIKDVVFGLPVGSIHGPYIDGGEYKAVKVMNKMVIPDSVKARHILLKYADAVGRSRARVTADSLVNVLESGTNRFDSLAVKYSQDVGSGAKGGDLGYQAAGSFVKPFNDMVFYKAKKGEYNLVESQFGLHIIEVVNNKFINNDEGVQVGYISSPIIPSQDTQNELYAKVIEFSGKNTTMSAFETACAEQGLEVINSPTFKRNDYTLGLLGGGQPSRDIIKYAFKSSTSVGDVSSDVFSYQNTQYNYINKYVVAGLQSIVPAGMPPVAAVKDQIELQVMNRAKAEAIKAKISGTDLSSIASSFNSTVDTIRNVAFSATFQPDLGNEPKVIATAFNTSAGQMSNAVIGNSGVFLISPIQVTPAENGPSVAVLRNQMGLSTQNQVGTRLMESVRKSADVKDNRFTFF